MRSVLFLCAACLTLCSCSQPTASSSSQERAQPAEQLPQLDDGDSRVAVRSVKVTGALSRPDALSGLAQALPHVQRAIKDATAGGAPPRGTFTATFRTEPDGMIRMVLEGENGLTGPAAKGVVEKFSGSTMGRKWQFPKSSGPSLVETEFVVGE